MATAIYNDPGSYDGREWTELLRAMRPRDVRASLKAAYRREGGKVAAMARARLAGSGLRNAGGMKRSVRVRVYSRGGGFMVTVKPHGQSGYYTNSAGKRKPVAMWAEEGTRPRSRRWWTGGFTGSMPGYHFMARAESDAAPMVERDLGGEVEAAVMRRAAKLGWT